MDAKHSLGEPRCLISRSAILHNISLLKKAITPGTRICAVVKADAYGHDAQIVVETLCNFTNNDTEPPVVDCLAVADIDEASAIPSCELPILVLRPVENAFLGAQRARLEAAAHHGWVLTIASPAAAKDLARIAEACSERVNVQVMVNTGLYRAGVEPAIFDDLIETITSLPSLKLVGISTHFASSEEPENPLNRQQLAKFLAITHALCASDRPARPHRSACNSAGIYFLPMSHLDMVRPGISIYGIDPTCRPCIDRPFRPAMRWTAPLIAVRDVPAGCSVGYGQTWSTNRPTKLGLIPIGYADGYSRAMSNRAVMIVHGQSAPVVGAVSMDLTVIDLQNAPQAAIGDEVTILDNDPISPASAYKLAELEKTIPYEIFCRIGKRVRRVAVDDFAPIENALKSNRVESPH